MERRKFGNTDLEVSAISLGCWPFGVDWWGHYTDERAFELLNSPTTWASPSSTTATPMATAGPKRSSASGSKHVPRDQVEIGGKFGYDFYSDPGEAGSHRERKQDFSPKFLRFALEKSLQPPRR